MQKKNFFFYFTSEPRLDCFILQLHDLLATYEYVCFASEAVLANEVSDCFAAALSLAFSCFAIPVVAKQLLR
jgi:hypothetical protein